MNRQMKKIFLFVGITYLLTMLFYGILQINGGRTNPVSLNLIGISMTFPFISFIIVQKLIFRENIKDSFGISFKLNYWFLLAILIPILMALVINVVSIVLFKSEIFSQRTFILNILIGLSIATFSALLEEFAWRGFLYKELKSLGRVKSSIYIGVLWALWHTPVTIWYKYPNTPLKGAVINFIQMFIVSIIISYIRDKSESIFASAIIHGMFNTMLLSSIMDDFKIVLVKILLGILVISILLIYDFYRKNVINRVYS